MTTKAPETIAIPVVDDDRIVETYTELKDMQVELDANPIEYGPRRFNNRIAKVRALLNRIEQMSLQASEDYHYFKRIINAKRQLYDMEKRELMVKDPTCRVGRSQGEREALADVRLRSQIEGIQALEAAAHDLEMMMISIRSKRTDLKDAQSRMRDQLKLIEHDISMGGRWGSSEPVVVSTSSSDLDGMIAEVDNAAGWHGEEAPNVAALGPAEEEEEDDDEEDAVQPKAAAPQELEPTILLSALVVDEEDALEVALSSKATVQFGDGELSQRSDVDAFLAEVPEVEVPEVAPHPGDGIDDLISSLLID